MAAPKPMGGFWARMTPRERNLVLALVLVFFGMGTIVLFYLRGNALRKTEQKIFDLTTALDVVYTRGTVYKEKLEQKKEREKSISTESVLWASLVEDAARVAEGIEVTSEEELGAQALEGGLLKRSYKFKLNNITLDALTKFLTKVETEPGKIIITEKLTIRSHNDKEDRLQVDVTLATWEREKNETDAEGDEDDGKAAKGASGAKAGARGSKESER